MSTAPSASTASVADHLGWPRRERELAELTESLSLAGFDVTSHLLVGPSGSVRERVEFADRFSTETHLALLLPLEGRASLVRYATTLYDHAASSPRVIGDFGWATRLLVSAERAPRGRASAASNAAYAVLLDRVLAADPVVLAGVVSVSDPTADGGPRDAVLSTGVRNALSLHEADTESVATAVALLDDLALGAPVEWALRRLGPTS